MATTATPTSRLRRPSTGAVCMSHAACHCHSVYQPLGLSSLTVRAEPVEASHLHSHALRQAQGERKFHRGRPFVFVSPDQFIPDTSARRRGSRSAVCPALWAVAMLGLDLDSRLRALVSGINSDDWTKWLWRHRKGELQRGAIRTTV